MIMQSEHDPQKQRDEREIAIRQARTDFFEFISTKEPVPDNVVEACALYIHHDGYPLLPQSHSPEMRALVASLFGRNDYFLTPALFGVTALPMLEEFTALPLEKRNKAKDFIQAMVKRFENSGQ